MKKVLNAMAAIVIALTGVTSMTGCSVNEIKANLTGDTAKASEPASNVCLVVSPTANQHKPDVSLFKHAAPEQELFQQVLDKFCRGIEDEKTVRILNHGE